MHVCMYSCMFVCRVVGRIALLLGRIFCILFGRSVTVVRSSFLRPRCTRLLPNRKDSPIRDIQDSVVCLDVAVCGGVCCCGCGGCGRYCFVVVRVISCSLCSSSSSSGTCSMLRRKGRSSWCSCSHRRSGCCCCWLCEYDGIILGGSSLFFSSFQVDFCGWWCSASASYVSGSLA